MSRRVSLPFAAVAVFAAACSGGQSSEQHGSSSPRTSPDTRRGGAAPRQVEISLEQAGLRAADMDANADRCADFFRYACGGWLERTKIPDDRARFGRFAEIDEKVQSDLKEIFAAATDPKLRDYYAACMDEAAVEKAGLSAIEPLRKKITSAKDRAGIEAAIAELHRHAMFAVFAFFSAPDFADATRVIAFVGQDGLALGDREYYLRDDAESKKVRERYRAHVTRMFELAGKKRAAAGAAAADVLKLETELARISKPLAELRDPRAFYNKVDKKGLGELAPKYNWDKYLAAIGRPEITAISVDSKERVKKMDALLASQPVSVWKNYLEWQLLHGMAPTLTRKLVDENFELTRLLTGVAVQKPRWKRCVDASESALQDLVAKEYIVSRQGAEAKEAARAMFAEISAAFERRIGELTWMSPATRAEAVKKLGTMEQLVGYPDKWHSYDFAVTRDNYAANALVASAFEMKRQMDKIEKPYDRTEWEISPTVVNAFYNPFANQLVFPLAILTPPFFHAKALPAVNLGALGYVVGHEITHGFDDSGAQFDEKGNLKRWWTDEDEKEFKERGQCVVEQFASYEPLDGVKLDGKLTLGENIADLGGIKTAFAAHRAIRDRAPVRYRAGGFDEDQLFFLAVGQAWCSADREAEIRRRAITDPHAPPRFRVNGTLSNLPEFRAAFGCKEGAPLAPATTCEVW